LVGAQGAVVGVDPAPAMRAMTERRVEGAANAEVLDGGATAIPLDDDSVDRALSVQVLEYVADVEAALAELHRVLRPGGRLVIWDVDWSTLSWHAEDADRAARVLAAWDGHVAHPALPRRLGGLLRAGGFADVGCAGHAFTTIDADLQTYGGLAAPMVAQWLETVEDPALAQDGRGWVEEQRRLGEQGAYFFSVTQCCFTATRPA
ncbi:MAG TPA: methyltransferase domain-containing protein, partial [Baekduia sp.]|nr:methyltransferase domain-containing protein [Baekduia sp.]